MNRIITLDDLVARDEQHSVEKWILRKCAESIKAKKIPHGWDGKSIGGEPVLAFINSGRWLARCKVCGNPNYVSWKTPILYCPECGNGGIQAAYPVTFPDEREQIESVLLLRRVEVPKGVLVRNDVERAMKSQPVTRGLTRDWRPGKSVQQLTADNDEALRRR